MAVVNCGACVREKDKTLVDGREACGYCPDHRAECEARFVLTMRTRFDRKQYLEGIASRRGLAAANELESLAMSIWEARRGKG